MKTKVLAGTTELTSPTPSGPDIPVSSGLYRANTDRGRPLSSEESRDHGDQNQVRALVRGSCAPVCVMTYSSASWAVLTSLWGPTNVFVSFLGQQDQALETKPSDNAATGLSFKRAILLLMEMCNVLQFLTVDPWSNPSDQTQTELPKKQNINHRERVLKWTNVSASQSYQS